MKIVLIGSNGRMGQEIKSIVQKTTDEIVCGVDIGENGGLNPNADVIIDFSTCDDRKDYIKFAYKNKIPYACFSTKLSKKDEVAFKNLSKVAPVLLCENSSAGFGAMFEAVKNALECLKIADIALVEHHHKNKKDKPSGTALLLKKLIESKGFDCQMQAFRVSNEKGRHCVQIFLDDEVVEISHQVFSRKIFATGAIELARELLQKSPGLYKKYKT